MWSNSLWEQEHQEELYQAFMEECLSGGPENFVSPVRQIVCGGCGRLFYTRVHSKKYCKGSKLRLDPLHGKAVQGSLFQ